jgi:hypothetical protein
MTQNSKSNGMTRRGFARYSFCSLSQRSARNLTTVREFRFKNIMLMGRVAVASFSDGSGSKRAGNISEAQTKYRRPGREADGARFSRSMTKWDCADLRPPTILSITESQ